jgi:hypothetical protein
MCDVEWTHLTENKIYLRDPVNTAITILIHRDFLDQPFNHKRLKEILFDAYFRTSDISN